MSESILYIETPNGKTYGVGPTKVSQLENDSGFTTFDDLDNNPRVTNAITSWLNENLTGDSSIAIDSSLSIANAAADAKITGDAISKKFELPSGGQSGQALLSDGAGGAEWGNVAADDTEAEKDVYGFTDADYTAVDITDQFTAANYMTWTPTTNTAAGTVLSSPFLTPQKLIIYNDRTDASIGLRVTRFLDGSDPSTATAVDSGNAGDTNYSSYRWNCDVPANENRVIYTHEFGRTGFEYMQIRWTSGSFSSWNGKFRVIAYYTDKRPQYVNELEKNDGFEHDVEMRFTSFVNPNWSSAANQIAYLVAVVPFYPNRKYTIKGGYWANVLVTNIDAFALFDDAVFEGYRTQFRVTSHTNGYWQPPSKSITSTVTVIQSGATNGGQGILEYTCPDPTETGLYPKWVAFTMYAATKPDLQQSTEPYPFTNETVAAWMDAAMTALDNKAPWGYVTAFDELIDRKASDTDFVNPNVWKKYDAGSMYKAFSANDGSPMKGATLTVFGDSISDNFGGHNLVGAGFISKICREFGMQIDNRAKSGSNMCISTDSYASVSGVYQLQAYLDAVDAETIEQSGYILIEFGANCYDTYVGSASDTSEVTTTSYYGATKYFIEQLRARSPLSVFGFILPHDVDWGNTSTSKQAGVPLARAAIKEVCEEYRVPYFDMYNDSGLTASMLSDGVHIGTPQSANLYYHAVRRFVMGL